MRKFLDVSFIVSGATLVTSAIIDIPSMIVLGFLGFVITFTAYVGYRLQNG